jgi:hypothetical protein
LASKTISNNYSVIHAYEVKNSAKVRPADLRPLKAFGEDYTDEERRLIYRGKESFVRNGIRCHPCDEFLQALEPGKL